MPINCFSLSDEKSWSWVPGVLLACAALLGMAVSGWAWTARISSHQGGPPNLFVVDKSRQTVWFLEKQSPLRTVRQMECSTGQLEGDKHQEGDLRTPEGVYFLEGRIKQDLDFELYGDLAYALNFPNPVDRMQGKTGYGIWLHGRGKELVPADTRGCVAIDTAVLAGLSDQIEHGLTPVVISQQTELEQDYEDPVAEDLPELVFSWARAWQEKKDDFFTFYDREGFSRSSGKPFQSFEDHKKRLFSLYPWIHVYVDDVRVVRGPGYWVTYFGQYYRTPSFVSEGVKRLYWQAGESGIRIVGSEWLPAQLDLEDRYIASLRPDITECIERWRQAWEGAELKRYLSFYAPGSTQDQRRGIEAIGGHKRRLWTRDAPAAVDVDDLRISTHPKGFEVGFIQRYRSGSGYEDLGRKTMLLAPDKGGWSIVQERWQDLGGKP